MNPQIETSDVRGEPGFAGGAIPQAQTPRPASKMPPMGQFDPPSTSKDNKKRRGGPGAATTNSSTIQQAPETSLAQGSRNGPVQVGNASKVSSTIIHSLLHIYHHELPEHLLLSFTFTDCINSARKSQPSVNLNMSPLSPHPHLSRSSPNLFLLILVDLPLKKSSRSLTVPRSKLVTVPVTPNFSNSLTSILKTSSINTPLEIEWELSSAAILT